jgi:hypothetical protein
MADGPPLVSAWCQVLKNHALEAATKIPIFVSRLGYWSGLFVNSRNETCPPVAADTKTYIRNAAGS